MRTPLILALALSSLSAVGHAFEAAPAMAQTPVGAHPDHERGDDLAREGVRLAKEALREHRRLEDDLRHAHSARDRAIIEAAMLQLTEGALEDVLERLGQIYRNSPPSRVLIYQIAKDALGSGNRGDLRSRVAYHLEALRQIAVQRP